MSDTVPVNFRVLETEREAWKKKAADEGLSLTQLVRRTMNERLGADRIVTAVALQNLRVADSVAKNFQSTANIETATVPSPSLERPRRTETCDHRLPPETFCKWCDE